MFKGDHADLTRVTEQVRRGVKSLEDDLKRATGSFSVGAASRLGRGVGQGHARDREASGGAVVGRYRFRRWAGEPNE